MKQLLILCSAFLLTACGPSQKKYDALLAQNQKYEEEIANLKTIIENYENTPDRLYSSVPELIRNKDIDGLTSLCEKLKKYHPSSEEYKKAEYYLRTLVDERDSEIKQEKSKRMQAVNKLVKQFDDISGITWYYNPYFTHYNNTNLMSIYIGQKGTDVWLRLKMSYEGDNWIFFENAYLSFDGYTKTILFNEFDEKETDNGSGRVWEWIDVSVDEELLTYLKQMSNGSSLKMRLSGKYTHTRILTEVEKEGLQDVLLAYDVIINGE